MSRNLWRNDLTSKSINITVSADAGSAPSSREPLIAVVGRPNVGKSTLFNRLLKKRRAITHPQPGVTRDVVSAEWSVGDRPVRLLDTGGVTPEGDAFHRVVSERSVAALARAHVVLLVMDVTETTAEDQLFLEALAPHRDRTILVVNKVDTEKRDPDVWDFHRFGFSDVVAISAEHGRGIDDLLTAVTARLDAIPRSPDESGGVVEGAAGGAPPTDPGLIRISVLGQPNTGKSTLCNTLVGYDASIVSDLPGTTRDVVEERFSSGGYHIRILDTAGIRRKKRVTEDIEYYSVTRAIDTIDESDVILLLVDADKGLSEQDKKIASLVVKAGKGIVLVLNKWDLLADTKNQFEAVRDRIHFLFPVLEFAPVVPVSALNRTGLDRLLKATTSVFRQLTTRVDTGPLNAALARWVTRTPPPLVNRHPLKLRYLTHVQVNPSVFVLFSNRSVGFPDAYLSYIKNQIRREFGLTDIPIRIEVRSAQKS